MLTMFKGYPNFTVSAKDVEVGILFLCINMDVYIHVDAGFNAGIIYGYDDI